MLSFVASPTKRSSEAQRGTQRELHAAPNRADSPRIPPHACNDHTIRPSHTTLSTTTRTSDDGDESSSQWYRRPRCDPRCAHVEIIRDVNPPCILVLRRPAPPPPLHRLLRRAVNRCLPCTDLRHDWRHPTTHRTAVEKWTTRQGQQRDMDVVRVSRARIHTLTMPSCCGCVRSRPCWICCCRM
jgi:hypothetical protein